MAKGAVEMIIPDKVYDILKWVCTIVLPAIIVCFITVATLLGMEPELVTIISGIMTAINTLIGTLIGVSTIEYNKQ